MNGPLGLAQLSTGMPGVVEADSLQKRTNHASAELRASTLLERKRLSQKDTDERYAVPRGAEEERS